MARRYKFVRTPDPIYVTDEDEAEAWAEHYLDCPCVGFDTETTGLHKINARIKFFSFSDGETRICCPVRLLPIFAPVLEDPDIEKRMTNAKFDTHMCASHGILIRGKLSDTTVQSWLLDENKRGRHGLKQTCKDHLGLRMAPFKDVFGNVGSIDKEVLQVTRFHDILEAEDSDAAAEALISVGKADGPEEVIKSLKKLALSKQGGYVLDARKVLAQARIHGLANKTHGKWGYVVDYLGMLGGPQKMTQTERGQHLPLLEDGDLLQEAHAWAIQMLRRQIKIDMEPLEMLVLLVGDYASLDAWGSFTLEETLDEKLDDVLMDDDDDDPYSLNDYYCDVQKPYTRVLWNMERRGFKMNIPLIEKYRNPMGKEIGRIERDVVRMVGHDLNMNSSHQMRDAFYEKDNNGDWIDPFGLPPKHWTKGGASGVKMPSTNKEAIEGWAEKGDKVATALQEHRKLSKLHGTYLIGVPSWVDHRDRIHTDLKQHGTVTARLSSGDPNLQNIPARGPWGKKIRNAFIAGLWGDCDPRWCMDELLDVPVPDLPEDFPMTLIVADYEQLEMRIMAHFSQDETMIDAIKRGLDLHCRTAELAGGHDYDELRAAKKADKPTPKQEELLAVRQAFKSVGFGLIYGIGPVKLGRQLGFEIEEHPARNGRVYERCPKASQVIKDYFGVFPDAKDFIDYTHKFCEEEQYVQTLVGRFRRLPDIISSDKGMAAQARRQSVNSIIQGTAADITIQAMLLCEQDPVLRELGARMLLQIHDELVFEVPKDPTYIKPAKERIKELMENPFDMRVPIDISMDCADSWGAAK